jgi:hypothetical protein
MRFGLPVLLAFLALSTLAAGATGTVTIVQPDGDTNVYNDVKIKVLYGTLYMTTADQTGTMIISRAACSHQGKLMVCLATNATLIQSGKTSPLDFRSGTIYANDTDDYLPLVLSTQKVPPHSILLSMTTKRGTYVSLSGRIDQVLK